METFIKIIGGSVLVIGSLFLIIILSTLMGGIAGWAVGMVFTETISELKQFMGVSVTDFELGAALGFVGSFFRTAATSKS